MPAKKAVPQQSDDSTMAAIWKWVFVGGALIAGLAGAAGFAPDILTWLLILAGVLVGIVWRDTDDLKGFGIRYLLLGATVGALSAVPLVGGYFTGFFQGFFTFLGPVALTTLVMYFIKKYFQGMM